MIRKLQIAAVATAMFAAPLAVEAQMNDNDIVETAIAAGSFTPLAASFFVPAWSAERVARVEGRASTAARGSPPLRRRRTTPRPP